MQKVKFIGGPEDGKIKELNTDREFIVFDYPIHDPLKSFKETCAYTEKISTKRAVYAFQRWRCKVGEETDEDDLSYGEIQLKLNPVTRCYYKVIEAWKARLYAMEIPTEIAGDYKDGYTVRETVRDLDRVKGHNWNEFLLFLEEGDPERLTERYWSFKYYLAGHNLINA